MTAEGFFSASSEWLSHPCQPLTALCLDRVRTGLFSRSTPMASLLIFHIKKSHLSEQPDVSVKLWPSCFLFAFCLSVLFYSVSAASPRCYHLLNLFFLAAQYSVSSCCTSSLLPQNKLLPQICFTYWYFPLPSSFSYTSRGLLFIWGSANQPICNSSYMHALSFHLVCHPQTHFCILPSFLAAFQALTPFFSLWTLWDDPSCICKFCQKLTEG